MLETLTNQTASESQSNEYNESFTREQFDLLDQLLIPEVQESLNALVENLPKLTDMITILTKTYDLMESVSTDRVLIEDFKGGMEELLKPIQMKAKDMISVAIEANDRAQMDSTNIGMFGLIRMIKDPQVQKMFRLTQAFLVVLSERKKQV
jgi:uncharacterized protein YjgD (DUF1641 family)